MSEKCDCDGESAGGAAKIENKLYEARTLVICGDISQKLAHEFTKRILAMSLESDADIKLILHSQGGHVESGDTIHDMIRFVKPRVKILGSGWVASAGVLIYLAVPKEDRYSLPSTRYMIHQPLGGAGGSASDITIEANEIVKMRARINRQIAAQTGQPLDKVERDTDRNFWMGPEEASDYGIVGKVISKIDQF
ncbi:MAG: ATP-dependent Clp protease proteolytic subunit [Bdellovibrionales bacterium RIFOXYD1_FULL_53_11]|nr:MAG: ATP-dependent Clp protease proteolytic subunit [Bdellovibrionales bacterium RIFOXYD1_FULL_53_11]